MLLIPKTARVSALTYSIETLETPLLRTCQARRGIFSGTLAFDVRDPETGELVLHRELADFEIDLSVFDWWQDRRESAMQGAEEALVGGYLDEHERVSYMRAHQVLDGSDPAARRVASYMVGGLRRPSIEPEAVAVPPFHDPAVVAFFCATLPPLVHRRPATPLPTLTYPPAVPASELIRQTGTKCLRQLKAALAWGPDRIFAFPNCHGEMHTLLTGGQSPRALAALDPRVTTVLIGDPTQSNPWREQELRAFQEAVVDAARELTAQKKVLFVCEGGNNRSRAAAIAASRLARRDAASLLPPVDASLLEVVEHVVAGNVLGLAALAPFFPRRAKRSRASPGLDAA